MALRMADEESPSEEHRVLRSVDLRFENLVHMCHHGLNVQRLVHPDCPEYISAGTNNLIQQARRLLRKVLVPLLGLLRFRSLRFAAGKYELQKGAPNVVLLEAKILQHFRDLSTHRGSEILIL